MYWLLPNWTYNRLRSYLEVGNCLLDAATRNSYHEITVCSCLTVRLLLLRKIIHISDKNAKVLGINKYVSTDAENTIQENPLYQQIQVAV